MPKYLLLTILMSASAPNHTAAGEEPQQPNRQQAAEAFMTSMMENLATGDVRDTFEQGLRSGKLRPIDMLEFGAGICSALARGASKEDVLNKSYYHFWGVAASDAMYAAALEVLCPDLAATLPEESRP